MPKFNIKTTLLTLACFLSLGTAIGVAANTHRDAIQTHAADYDKDVTEKYIGTKNYIWSFGQSQNSAGNTTTSAGITYSWSGTGGSGSYFTLPSGSTFTVTMTNIPNNNYVTYGRFMVKSTSSFNVTLTMTAGSKTATKSISGSETSYWYPDVKGGGTANSVVMSIKNNAGSALQMNQGYADIYVSKKAVVTLDANGGSGGSSTVDCYYNHSYPTISNPIRSGYRFLGYYDSKTGGTQYFNASGCPSKSAWDKEPATWTPYMEINDTLYAQWEVAEQTVNVSAGAGISAVTLSTNTNGSNAKNSGAKFSSNATVYAFATLKKGYKAKSGWVRVSGTENTEGAKYRVGSKTVGTSTVNFGTISADLITYTISYNLNGGTAGGNNKTSYSVTTSTFEIINPTKTGYIFKGWSGTGLTGDSNKSVYIQYGSIDNRSFTANWTAATYDVSLNCYPGWSSANYLKATYDSALPSLAGYIPVRDSSEGHSYSFGGYYTEEPTDNGEGVYSPNGKRYYDEEGNGAVWKETEDTTLHAYWTVDMTVESEGYEGTWDGELHGIEVNPISPEGTTVYYGNSASTCNSTNAADFYKSEAGSYDVYFQVRKDGYTTYKGHERILINKDQTIIDPAPHAVTGLEYTGENQELIYEGTADYGTMLYAANTTGETPDESEFSAAIPTGKTVGTYYVFYKTNGDNNHNPYPLEAENAIQIDIVRVDRTDIIDLNQDVLDYLETIDDDSAFEEIAARLENVRKEVYDAAIVEDNINVSGVNFNIEKLADALSAAKIAVTEALIDKIGTVSYPNSGEAIQEAAEYYNDILNEEEKAAVDADKKAVLEQDKELYEAIDEVAELIKAIPEPENDEDYFEKVIAAKEAYEGLNETQKALIDEAEDKDYEKILNDNVAAKEVIEKIEAIGTLTYNGGTDDSLEGIVEAEDAYADLTEDQKELVNAVNHATLESSRESYDEVDDAVKLITEIGEVNFGGEEDSKEALEAARRAYDALSEEEKALVSGFEDSYKTLDDAENVYEVLELFDAIGEVDFTHESEDKINEAREAYDSLTEDQKAQLGQTRLLTLEKAEQEYTAKKEGANLFYLIALIVSILLLIIGLIVMVLLLRRKKEDDSNKKKPLKAASFVITPFVVFASHLIDTPFLILYAIIAATIIVWLIDLIIAIVKSHKRKVADEALPVDEPRIEEEDEVLVEEGGVNYRVRYVKSFLAHLSQSGDDIKSFYNELKNEILAHESLKSDVSWTYDSINLEDEEIIKFGFRGKDLCIHFALDTWEVDERYTLETSESKKLSEVPSFLRVKDEDSLRSAKELINILMAKLHIERGEGNYERFAPPYMQNATLLEKGLAKESRIKINPPLPEINLPE